MAYFSCHQNICPKILKDESFFLSLEGIISNNKKLTPICHDKMTHLAYNCVTMNELMDKFYENTELGDVICENWSKISGKISKTKLEKYQSVLNPPMQLRVFLQISEYNGVRDEYF